MKTKTDYNSTVNQEIKGKFVQREVLMNMNCWVEYYINNHPEDYYETFENLDYPYCIECGSEMIYEEEYDNHACTNCKFTDDSPDTQLKEIFKYWAVSVYLYNELKKQGEPVAEINNTYIWGRTTTGQAILLDGVISRICFEMEILEGQKYSWA